MQVKICGITNLEDALLAKECGAAYLGLIFVESSARKIQLQEARTIVQRMKGELQVVGVFANHPAATVNDLARELHLELVQLHGEETPEYCRTIDRTVIKALSVAGNQKIAPDKTEANFTDFQKLVDDYAGQVDYLLFDKPKQGAEIGWLKPTLDIIVQLKNLPPYFFAGGLNSSNVNQVIKTINPMGLDIASGVEERPGKKDHDAVRKFMQTVSSLNSQKELI